MGLINGGLINPSNQGAGGSSSSQLALSDGLACFTASFSGVTSTQFSHGLGTTDLVVEFKDSTGNLLIPDNWFIINSNVIQAEFSPAATGDVTVIGCIESGLAPITGGVTTIEGLSGIVDLDSPNNSIVISTSGQVINLNAIFTPASGATLEQTLSDIITLSGLIGAGGGGSATIINGLSGTVTLAAANNGIEVLTSGQTILFSPLFTYTSGQIIDQNTRDITSLSGIVDDIVSDAGQTSINGLSGQVQLTSPDNSILIGDNGQAIELSGLFTPASGVRVNQLIHERRWHGVVSGLDVSINTVNSGLFDVSDGVAYVSGIRVVFAAQSGIDPSFPDGAGANCENSTAFVGLDYLGNIFTVLGYPIHHNALGSSIDVGVLRLSDPSGVNSGLLSSAQSEAYEILDLDHNDYSWHAFAVGAVVASGVLITDNGSLTLAASQGVFYDRLRNRHEHEGDAPLEFYEILHDSNGDYFIQGTLSTTVRNTVYDNGFGLVAITGNRFVTHSLWFDVITDEHFMVISNDEYISLQQAQDAPIDPGCILDRANIIPTAKIVIQRNQTVFGGDTGRIVDVRPIIGARSDAGVLATTSTTLQQAYDNSLVEEIVLDNQRGPVDFLDNPTNPLVNSGKGLFHVHGSDTITSYFEVDGSGIYAPSGVFEHKVGIGGAFPRGSEARCTLDVSGLICASGLEIVGTRPTLSGIGLATLADIIDTQMTLNGLSGAVTLTSPNSSIGIGVNGQDIELSGIFTWASGQILDQKCADIDTLSGLSVQNTADILALGNYASGIDTRLVSLSGLTDGLLRTQTSVQGVSGVIALAALDGTMVITVDGQTIQLSGLFNPASGQIIDQIVEDLSAVSGVSATATQKAVLLFTPTSGTEFVMQHGLQTEDFLFNLWRTDTSPIVTVIPDNVYPSGVNHVVVSLNSAMSGKLVLTG